MAHHKKGRLTSKKENKRLDHKTARQAERQALRGDNARSVRSYKWGRPDQAPILDATTPAKPKAKKRRVRKPKEKCPVNGHHAFLKDTVIETNDYGWYNREGFWVPRTHRYERKFKLCVYCGKEKTLKMRFLRG